MANEHADDRRGPYRHIDLRDSFGQPARQAVALRNDIEPQREVSSIRNQFARSGGIGQGLGQRPTIIVDARARMIGRDVLGIEPDRLAVVRDGAVSIALGSVRKPTVMVGIAVIGIEPERLVVVRDRAITVALGQVSVTAVVVDEGVPGIEPDRLIAVRDGAIMVAVGIVRVAAAV